VKPKISLWHCDKARLRAARGPEPAPAVYLNIENCCSNRRAIVGRVVGASVVDHQHLEARRGARLSSQGAEAALKRVTSIVRANGDRDLRTAHWPGVLQLADPAVWRAAQQNQTLAPSPTLTAPQSGDPYPAPDRQSSRISEAVVHCLIWLAVTVSKIANCRVLCEPCWDFGAQPRIFGSPETWHFRTKPPAPQTRATFLSAEGDFRKIGDNARITFATGTNCITLKRNSKVW